MPHLAMKLLVNELITFEPVLPIKVSLWKPSFSTDHIHKVSRKSTERPSAIKAESLNFSQKLFNLKPSVVIYRREITKMCNDPKIYVPDEERVTQVIAKIDTLYPNGTFEVIYSGVKMCLHPS